MWFKCFKCTSVTLLTSMMIKMTDKYSFLIISININFWMRNYLSFVWLLTAHTGGSA